MAVCQVPECGVKARCRGWCHKHYTRWRHHGDPTTVLPRGKNNNGRHRPDIQDAIDRAIAGGPECVPYPGRIGIGGYGNLSHEGTYLSFHRLTWLLSGRALPSAPLSLDHACHDPLICPGGACLHRACGNVDHLRISSQQDQLQNSILANRTTCRNGLHAWSEENIYVHPNGDKSCKQCRRTASAYHARRRKGQ